MHMDPAEAEVGNGQKRKNGTQCSACLYVHMHVACGEDELEQKLLVHQTVGRAYDRPVGRVLSRSHSISKLIQPSPIESAPIVSLECLFDAKMTALLRETVRETHKTI